MKAPARTASPLRALAAAVALIASAAPVAAADYGTAFTYQGALKASGTAMTGTVDLEFSIYDVATSGVPLTVPIELLDVPVNDGVFTVELDFGTLPQDKEARWLQIVVNSTILSPRQKLSPTPLAQQSLSVPLVFGGQIHESPYWLTNNTGAFASPSGITEAVYTESRAQFVMPKDCTARNLHVRNASVGSYPDTTVTLRVNGIDTLLACAQTALAGATCSNTGDSIALEAGDLVSLKFSPGLPARPLSNAETEIRARVMFGWMCE